ncbi:MAG: cytidine deaminase [Pseudomonadota bacterium]
MLIKLLLFAACLSCNASGMETKKILPPDPARTAVLADNISADKFVLTDKESQALQKKLGVDAEQLIVELVPVAKKHARPPISNYFVGAVGLTKSGKIVFGNNLEFKGVVINDTVHAEQFLTMMALFENDELVTIAVSAEPCGFCRQFLNEIKGASKNLKVLVPGKAPRYLGELLPDSFGPDNLNVDVSVYSPRDNRLELIKKVDDKLILTALENANKAYSPYSSSFSGAAIKMKSGKIYGGFYVENAAYNPSMQPLNAAIIKLVSDGGQYGDIKEVVLAEKKDAPIKQEAYSEALIKAINPKAEFKLVTVL